MGGSWPDPPGHKKNPASDKGRNVMGSGVQEDRKAPRTGPLSFSRDTCVLCSAPPARSGTQEFRENTQPRRWIVSNIVTEFIDRTVSDGPSRCPKPSLAQRHQILLEVPAPSVMN